MEDNVFVSQTKYAKSILKKIKLDNASHKRTPATTHGKKTKDEKGVDVGQSLYISTIESLFLPHNKHT